MEFSSSAGILGLAIPALSIYCDAVTPHKTHTAAISLVAAIHCWQIKGMEPVEYCNPEEPASGSYREKEISSFVFPGHSQNQAKKTKIMHYSVVRTKKRQQDRGAFPSRTKRATAVQHQA